MAFEDRRVINGTYGEMWLDSEEMGEVFGLNAKIKLNTQEVSQCKRFMTGEKVIGGKGEGTVKLHKVTSRMAKLLAQCIKNKQFPVFTIISNLEDPDSFGAEKVKVTGVLFNELTLIDWEAGKVGEESYPFTFTSFEFIDSIDTKVKFE